MTSDTGDSLRYGAQRKIAKEYYNAKRILSFEKFEEVAWRQIYDSFHEVPRMFGIWTCKQVMNIADTNAHQAIYKKDHDPSCAIYSETCEHVLLCEEEGPVEALYLSISLINRWMRDVGTDNGLCCCLVKYARSRGCQTMEDITREKGQQF